MCTNILQFDPRNESDRAKIYSSHRVAHLSGGATCETCIARPYWMNGGPVYLERKCEFLSVSTCCTSTQSCNERSCCLNANRVVMLIRNLSRSPFFFCLFYSSLSVSFFSVFQSSFYFSLLPPHVASQLRLAGERTAIYKRRSFSISTDPSMLLCYFPLTSCETRWLFLSVALSLSLFSLCFFSSFPAFVGAGNRLGSEFTWLGFETLSL